MKKIVVCLVMITGLIICAGCINQDYNTGMGHHPEKSGNNSVTLTDMKGRTLIFSGPVNRIVCQSPDAAMLLMVIGAGKYIVGVPGTMLTYPYQASKMPDAVSIGSGSSPDLEKIANLHPDVAIIMTSSNPLIAEKLQEAHIPYLYIDGYKLANIPDEMGILGNLTNKTAEAEKYENFYSRYFTIINQRLSSIPECERPTVYFEGSTDYSTVGNTSGGDSLIRMAYGNNIAGSLGEPWPVVSPEWVLKEDPHIIIRIAYPGDLANATLSEIHTNILLRPTLNTTSAAKNNRVFIMHHRITSNAQGIASLVYLAKAFYPDSFTDIDPDEVLLEYDHEFLPGSYVENSFYPKFWKNESINTTLS
jgi:iron complex transport system substrate-binding protein